MKVSQLKKNPNNPRQIKGEKLELLKRSVGSFQKMMALRPIIVDENNAVLGGNMRLAAIKALGLKEIPDEWVKKADDLTEEEKREFIAKDNIGFGEWDWDVLANEWDAEELTEWGLDLPDFAAIEPQEIGNADAEPQIDKAAELNKKWKVKAGDLFKIGGHRLICGDSTSPQDVLRLMGGERAELLFTSPPYSDQREYEGDADLSVEHIVKFIPAFADVCSFQVVNLGLQRKDHEIIEYWQDYIIEARTAGYKLMAWNVWKKNTVQIGQQSAFIPIYHEWIFVFGKDFKHINRTEERKTKPQEGNVRKARQADGSMKASTIGFQGERKEMESVFISNPELGDIRGLHPATFPIELPSQYIQAMTNAGQVVCEPFGGSGTTLVAAQNLNRKCYAIEISENYCAVILERMATAFPGIEIERIEDAKGRENAEKGAR